MAESTEGISTKIVLLLLLACFASPQLPGQERPVDPTWLHRFVPNVMVSETDLSSETCHYKAIFGQGDSENRIMRSIARFGEATLDRGGKCQSVTYDRQEELYFVLEGKGELHYGDHNDPISQNDFTYLPPGVKHSLENNS